MLLLKVEEKTARPMGGGEEDTHAETIPAYVLDKRLLHQIWDRALARDA